MFIEIDNLAGIDEGQVSFFGVTPDHHLQHRSLSYQGDLYLTDEAAAIQRLTALQMLDVVRRAVAGP